ncbi:Protein HIR1 [Folsomia candida]|uniref:Protein HIR1 n=1 Tax=Folsomia candida TaxID=158441 RepID=A0A226D6U8_FOLCA|nr:Protein HIR1 [Folsomia candida]
MNLFLVSFIIAVTISGTVGKIDVNKELATYSSCNGKPVVFSADTVTQGLFVAPQCWAIEDEFCAQLCVFKLLDGAVKGGKLSKAWFKTEGKKTTMGDGDAKEKILKGLDKCMPEGKWIT